MVDEKESVENDEAKVDDGAKEPARKAGRPARKSAPKPAAAEQPQDTATKDGEKEQAPEENTSTKKVEDNSGAPNGRIIPEGEEANIKTREEHGVEVAAENVYRKRLLPNSSRYTYILVAAEGTRIQ